LGLNHKESITLETVKSGDPISIKADETVEVGQQGRLLTGTKREPAIRRWHPAYHIYSAY